MKRVLTIIIIILLILFITTLTIDYIQYDKLFSSYPFSIYILTRGVEFLLPAIILLFIRKRSK